MRLLLRFSVVFATMASASAAPASRPNVLFIAIDDLRPSLGCYGDPVALTPHLDALAARGVRFDRAYCQQAVCNPSRSSVFTGLRPDTIHVWDNRAHFRRTRPGTVTLPQAFRAAGYETASVGKLFHDPRTHRDAPSWSQPERLDVTAEVGGKWVRGAHLANGTDGPGPATEFEGSNDHAYIDGRVADDAVRLLATLRDRPFFLAVGFRRPHLPFTAPASYAALYRDREIPPPVFPQPPAGAPELALHPSRELRNYADMPKTGPLTAEQIAALRRAYYASTSFADAQVGRVLAALREQSLEDNTIIVIWSDHGVHLGEHGLWVKTTNFELDVRVPLLIAAPRVAAAGRASAALVELVDLFPTLAELCGVPAPAALEGRSLVPLLRDPTAARAGEEAAYSQFPRPWFYEQQPEVMGYSVRSATHRYTEWREWRGGRVIARELYAYGPDLLERENIADRAEQAVVQQRMAGLLARRWPAAGP